MSEAHAWTDRAALFALDALDDEERRAFEAHLAECESCREDVAAYNEVTARIRASVPPVEPPPTLRARVLSAARAERAIASAPSERKRVWYTRPAASWLATAAVLVLFLGAGALLLAERRARNELTTQLETTAGRVIELEAELSTAVAQAAARDSLLATLLAADVAVATLVSDTRPPGARVYWNRTRGTVVLTAFDLPPAPEGRTYQLWGISEGRALSLGTFNTRTDGRTAAHFNVPGGARLEMSAVTEEPAGGSPQPTSPPFLAGALAGAR